MNAASSWRLDHADCRAWLPALPAESADAIVCDPPYEIAFMANGWDRTRVPFAPDTWRAAMPVLKPGAHLLAFGGARTVHRLACAIEDAGFEVRDQLIWLYGSGGAKVGADDQGRATCVKPAHEPIVLARKPFRGSARANIAAHGTGGLNVGSCRVSQRWPANVVIDDSAEVASIFPTAASGGYPPAGGQRSQQAVFGAPNLRGAPAFGRSTGSAARYFYCAKASRADRDAGLDGRNPHPTVKPTALMRWLVRLVTPPGGLVLDPFAGSGSTGRGALLEGYRFAGCEVSADYVPIARARIAHAAAAVEPQA